MYNQISITVRKIFFMLGIALAIVGVEAQDLEGTLPHSIDRAMSVWARNRININFDTIYSDVSIIDDSVSNYNTRLIVLETADSTWLYAIIDTVQTKYIKLEPTLEKILFFDLSKMKKGVGSPPDDGIEQGFETLDFGATNDEESILMMRIYRDANNGSDTNTSEARLFDFHIHYYRDKI